MAMLVAVIDKMDARLVRIFAVRLDHTLSESVTPGDETNGGGASVPRWPNASQL